MTFDECRRQIESIRARQGTRKPLIRVDYGGSSYRGRLARSDSDAVARAAAASPYGVLVIEDPGLARAPQTILQIASIAPNAISDSNDN